MSDDDIRAAFERDVERHRMLMRDREKDCAAWLFTLGWRACEAAQAASKPGMQSFERTEDRRDG